MTAIRSVYFHPLSSFPGPKLAAASNLVHVYHSVTGNLSRWTESLHREYGDTVRSKPNELSFINEAAWKDIYQHRPQMSKELYIDPVNGVHSLLTADDENHTRMRRILAFAFSEKALREQEPILRDYVDLLIQKLREESEGGKLVDIVNWYNYTTFDIIGDLCFGESFHNLDNKGEHPWISGVLKAVKMGMLHAQTRVIPSLGFVVKRAMPIYLKGARSRIFGFTQERVNRRLKQKMQRPDFMTYVLKNDGTEKGLSRPEIDTNFLMLTNAGSETTATTLSGCTYYLLRNPRVLRRLKEEIRGSLESEKITVAIVNKLPYLTAVLTETLRIHAPAPISFPRFVNPGGATINGRWVPGGVSCYIDLSTVNIVILIELLRLSWEYPTVLPINPNLTL